MWLVKFYFAISVIFTRAGQKRLYENWIYAILFAIVFCGDGSGGVAHYLAGIRWVCTTQAPLSQWAI